MKLATIVFFVREGKICLAPKLRGFGAGKLNGYGGKINEAEGETLAEGLVREVREESGVTVRLEDCEQVASIKFSIQGKPAFHDEIFFVRKWEGEPRKMEKVGDKEVEMGDPEWYYFDKLPLEKMWLSDSEWLPKVLNGEKFRGEINFSEKEILSSTYEPAEFERLGEITKKNLK